MAAKANANVNANLNMTVGADVGAGVGVGVDDTATGDVAETSPCPAHSPHHASRMDVPVILRHTRARTSRTPL